MVGTVNEFDTGYSIRRQATVYGAVPQVRSVDASYIEPDLLVQKYFAAAPVTRANSRRAIARSFKSIYPILEVVMYGADRKFEDAYHGAIDLLAECDEYLLRRAVVILLNSTQTPLKYQSRSQLLEQETYWEVLIRGIGCAYGIPGQRRLQILRYLLSNISAAEILTRRVVKAAMIDSLSLLADEEGVDKNEIKLYIGLFMEPLERDQYIRTYAEDALEDLK